MALEAQAGMTLAKSRETQASLTQLGLALGTWTGQRPVLEEGPGRQIRMSPRAGAAGKASRSGSSPAPASVGLRGPRPSPWSLWTSARPGLWIQARLRPQVWPPHGAPWAQLSSHACDDDLMVLERSLSSLCLVRLCVLPRVKHRPWATEAPKWVPRRFRNRVGRPPAGGQWAL